MISIFALIYGLCIMGIASQVIILIFKVWRKLHAK